MTRREFPKQTKRDALRRSGGKCEASGPLYGLDPGQRCNASLTMGVEFDHATADAIGGEPTLENCVSVCRKCHRFKTSTYDTPRAAKTKRQRDKNIGIASFKRSWPRRPFNQDRRDNTRYLNEDMSE